MCRARSLWQVFFWLLWNVINKWSCLPIPEPNMAACDSCCKMNLFFSFLEISHSQISIWCTLKRSHSPLIHFTLFIRRNNLWCLYVTMLGLVIIYLTSNKLLMGCFTGCKNCVWSCRVELHGFWESMCELYGLGFLLKKMLFCIWANWVCWLFSGCLFYTLSSCQVVSSVEDKDGEDSYQLLRKAWKEYRATMNEYYKAVGY
jgi:hypothetical protein